MIAESSSEEASQLAYLSYRAGEFMRMFQEAGDRKNASLCDLLAGCVDDLIDGDEDERQRAAATILTIEQSLR